MWSALRSLQGKSMSLKDETPDTGRDAEGFWNRCLTLLVSRRILRLRFQDKHSLTHKPHYLATASQKHCGMSAFGSLTFKKDQILFCKEWNKDRPLSSTTDIALNGDGWNNKYRPLATLGPMSGKWGSFDLNKRERMK